MRVAYLGPEGTYTQLAARRLFGLAARRLFGLAARRLFGLAARYRQSATIEAVFDAVKSGDATASSRSRTPRRAP